MKREFTWDANNYEIDGKAAFLVSGEFHYFRVPREDWRKRLELFQKAGGNCVATYIPWGLHEQVEGEITFGNSPHTDLEGFLQLCAEMNILVLGRPGPYQYSELVYDGLPGWLCENYPELRAADQDGKEIRTSSVSYMHPLFLEKVANWFDRVCPLLAKYTLKRGGPLAMVQLDNELMGIHAWFGSYDYNPETLGLGRDDGRYATFLRKRFTTIEKLNEAWDTDYESFRTVRPTSIRGKNETCNIRRIKDEQEFYFGMCAEYMVWLSKKIKAAGIDCDLVHNSGNPSMNGWFREICEALEDDFLLGSDHYYNLGSDWAQNNPTPQYAVKMFHSLSVLRNWGYAPAVFEMPAGSASDWPPILPRDLTCCYQLNLALGMKGLNYYIFTGGPNPAGFGQNGDSYDYGAPVAADGTLRESYQTLVNFGQQLTEQSWLSKAEQVTDFHLGMVTEYARSESYSKEEYSGFGPWRAYTHTLQGMLPTAFCASMSPGIVDLDIPFSADVFDQPLVVPAAACMSRKIQQRIIDYVLSGGQLLINPILPWMDENYEPCHLLIDFCGTPDIQHVKNAGAVHIDGVQNVVNNSCFISANPPSDAEILGVETNSGCPAAWKRNYPNGGSVLWLGLEWRHSKNEHSRMFRNLLRRLNNKGSVVCCDNANIWTVLRSDGERRQLFLMNLYTDSLTANIKVQDANGRYIDLGKQHVDSMSVKMIDPDK